MNTRKFLISWGLAISILMVQVGGVYAAPALQASTPVSGTVHSITLETNPNTGITTVIVEVVGKDQVVQIARISLETAIKPLGLVVFDGDGKAVINNLALGRLVEILPTMVIPDQEADRHPVGDTLATFFSDIEGVNYDAIMAAHDKGVGFGVIAQALWLTSELQGNSEIFQLILDAKENNDYSDFILDDGTTPKNWGQLRKAIMAGKKMDNLGTVMSNKDNNGNGKDKDKNKDQDKDKNKDNDNNGNGNGNGGGNGNGNNK